MLLQAFLLMVLSTQVQVEIFTVQRSFDASTQIMKCCTNDKRINLKRQLEVWDRIMTKYSLCVYCEISLLLGY